jgi:hypothetical protein
MEDCGLSKTAGVRKNLSVCNRGVGNGACCGSLRRWRHPNTGIIRFLNEGRRIASADFSALEFD